MRVTCDRRRVKSDRRHTTWQMALCALLLTLGFTACEHRELVDDTDMHYVRIYVDENIRNVTYGFYDETKEKPTYRTPEGVRVVLCNSQYSS